MRPRDRLFWIVAFAVTCLVSLFLWAYPVYSVDPKSRTGIIHDKASSFAWGLSELTELNGGRIVALDNHSSDFLAQVGLVEGKVPPRIYDKFRDLTNERAHFFTAPSAVGKKVEQLGEWELLTVVDSKEFRRFKGFTKDEIPLLGSQNAAGSGK